MIIIKGLSVYSPYVVRSGLVLYLDAGNAKSYPGSGTTWTDLSPNRYLGTLYNSPGYSSASGGGVIFDGTDDYVELNTNNIISGNNPFTFECFYKITAFNSGGEIFGNYGEGYSSANYIWISGEYGVYIGGAVYFPGYPLGAGTYYMAVTRTSDNSVKLYRDGAEVNSGTLTGSISAGPNFRIGCDTKVSGGVGGERLNGAIYAMRLYNRVLTTTELTGNYNSLRSRFGK